MKKYLSLIFVMIFALVLVGCGGNGGGNDNPDDNNTIKQIRVSGASEIAVGKKAKYTAKFTPADYANQEVTWKTSDEAKLAIDQKGEATAIKADKDGVLVYAYSKVDTTKYGQKRVFITDESKQEENFPDLNGYNIKIAQAEHALGNFDPFLDTYTQADKEAKQIAWDEVEEAFNCDITIDPYPSDAGWGPARWNYIINQAAIGVSDYDFLTIPDSKIGGFVEAGALIPLTNAYALHGKDMMDPSFVQSSTFQKELYGLTEGQNNIYNVMYYNVGLFEELKKTDDTLVEPAQLFNEGKWTYETFVNYCKQVQDAMESKYGEAGKAGSKSQEYFAAAGCDAYWFVGLSSNDGEPIANVKTMSINMDSDHRLAAANAVKEIYGKGYAAKKQGVDQNVIQWNEGKAFFNTGDLWFVGDDGRWRKNLWGEDTRYGYVPWPMPNDMSLDDYKIALGGTALWVMPIGRDYTNYGPECTTENIYWAVVEMLQRSEKYYKESSSYDKEQALKTMASKYAHSDASVEAFIKVQEMIEAGKGYFDPVVVVDNPVAYTAGGAFRKAITGYCVDSTFATWAGAIENLVKTMGESIRKAFN